MPVTPAVVVCVCAHTLIDNCLSFFGKWKMSNLKLLFFLFLFLTSSIHKGPDHMSLSHLHSNNRSSVWPFIQNLPFAKHHPGYSGYRNNNVMWKVKSALWSWEDELGIYSDTYKHGYGWKRWESGCQGAGKPRLGLSIKRKLCVKIDKSESWRKTKSAVLEINLLHPWTRAKEHAMKENAHLRDSWQHTENGHLSVSEVNSERFSHNESENKIYWFECGIWW